MDPSGAASPSAGKLTIETPELTSLEYSIAGIGSRFLALAVDTLIQLAVTLVLALPLLGLSAGFVAIWAGGATWPIAVLILVLFCIQYGYFALFEIIWSGQTPGKRLLRLRVIKDSGRPLTTYDALARNLLRLVDSLPGIYAVGIVSALISSQSKRLGDFVAGTVVVHERPQEETAPAWEVIDPGRGPSAGIYRLDTVSHGEIDLIETFLARRGQLSDEVRWRTSREIVKLLGPRLGIKEDEQRDPETILEEIAREGRRVMRMR